MSTDAIARLNAAFEGRYRIDGEVGRGGMAVVYRAEDLKHGRPVAIKVMRPELAEAMAEERFTREIEVAARLNHPNILGLIDSGEADGVLYFVMPFIEGESLRAVLDREGPLALDRATEFAKEIAGALSYAHEQGLVHRDVKPENVLLQAGHAVVCDFGIAKAMTEASRDGLTRTGTSVGTFAYMSPEQLSDGAEIDARSDVYALGCVLHEMLEGDVPFAAATPQAAMAKKLMGDVPDRSSRSDVPDSVWSVVRMSLATDAEHRFATADEFMTALGRASTEQAIVRGRRRRRIDRGFRFALGAAAVVVVGWAGSWLGGRVSAPAYERLAVMPLTNGSGDAREDFYVRGVYEDLVEEMQRAGLRVVNPSAVRRLSEEDVGVIGVADTLDVDAVLEGSVERVGPRVVIELRLSDGGTADVVWSESYSGGQVDVLQLLRRITRDVAEETGTTLDPETVAALQEADQIDAVLYELLLEGRYEAFKLTRDGLDRSQRFYERAIARDSMSTDAWRGLARVWGLRAQQGLVPADIARARADSIEDAAPVLGIGDAEQALNLTWFEWPRAQWAEAEAAFLSALENQPGDARTRAYYAQFLMYQGRDGEADREGSRAARQAPDDPLVQGLYSQLLTWLERDDEAEERLTRALGFSPEDPYLLAMLRTAYHLQGRDSLAIESWNESYRVRDDLEARDSLNAGYRRGGYEEALRAVADLFVDRYERAWDPDGDGEVDVSVWQVGTLYTRAGRHDEAIEYLGLAMDEGDPNSLSIAVDRIFDPMRDDPDFRALVDRLQLPAEVGR